ncbi:hypothetical protein PCL_12102 [Purpureocillium lilacinum]|uniref:HAT C-terminal dimerisation domain-containing protein n=1 Tax=Purpureocillium lilacinum TaxID=33203 RepID=A0A2U3DPG2_PURLI|nr:hypothetical protein PCL_12102 [Purpureocillium lilacinum]
MRWMGCWVFAWQPKSVIKYSKLIGDDFFEAIYRSEQADTVDRANVLGLALSTPAMSAEPQRVFSDGGELIADKRNGLGDDTVEAEMMQTNWITSKILRGITTPRGLYELPD